MKKNRWGIIYGILLTAFTIYLLLDTFVIPRTYTVVNQGEGGAAKANGIWTDNSYSDDNISINMKKYRQYDTTIYVAEIQLFSAEYLKTAFANNAYGRNVVDTTSNIASNVNAILAINGDYYGAREEGCVLRNGVLYREASSTDKEDLVIKKDGSLEIVTEKTISEQPTIKSDAQQIFSFGPALVLGDKILVTDNQEVGIASTSNQRTAIGIIDGLHYLFVVSDGRTNESKGLSLYQLAEFMKSIGADVAYNLDGGGSSTMIFNGKLINKPTTDGVNFGERSVSDIVYIGY